MVYQLPASGTGTLAAAVLGGAVCGLSPLGEGHGYWRTTIPKRFSHCCESFRSHDRLPNPGTDNPLGIWVWRSGEFDYRTSTGLMKQTLGGHTHTHTHTKKTPCVHHDAGERSSDPTRNWLRLAHECPGVSSASMGWWWPDARLGALSAAAHARGLLKEVNNILITSTIVWAQIK